MKAEAGNRHLAVEIGNDLWKKVVAYKKMSVKQYRASGLVDVPLETKQLNSGLKGPLKPIASFYVYQRTESVLVLSTATADSTRKSLGKQFNEIRTKTSAFLGEIAKKCISTDKAKFNLRVHPGDARAIVQSDWDTCDGTCCFCHRDIIGLGATDAGTQGSLDREDSTKSHFDKDQTRKFICLMVRFYSSDSNICSANGPRKNILFGNLTSSLLLFVALNTSLGSLSI